MSRIQALVLAIAIILLGIAAASAAPAPTLPPAGTVAAWVSGR